jgi:hypothetical protein
LADQAAVSAGLRERIFALSEADLTPASIRGDTLAALMDFTVGETWVSLVAVADGTTSLYFGSGGGIIGAGGKEAVRQASGRFLELAGATAAGFSKVDKHPVPDRGLLRFYVLKRDGTRGSAAVEEAAVQQPGHPLRALYAAGQDVITQMRLSGNLK